MQACQRHAGSRSRSSAGRQPLDGCLRPSSPSPSLSPSDPFLRLPSVRASLARPTPTQVMAAQPLAASSRQPPFLSLAQAIDVRAMNGHSGKQTWIRREKGTGGPPACTPARPARAAHGMDSAREDDDEASFSIRSSSLLPYTRYTFAMTMISLRSASFASCQGCRRL